MKGTDVGIFIPLHPSAIPMPEHLLRNYEFRALRNHFFFCSFLLFIIINFLLFQVIIFDIFLSNCGRKDAVTGIKTSLVDKKLYTYCSSCVNEKGECKKCKKEIKKESCDCDASRTNLRERLAGLRTQWFVVIII